MIRKLLLTLTAAITLSLSLSSIAIAQTVAVTGTITDTQTTPYSNGLLTVTFVNATGQLATFGGSPSFQKSYAIYLDSNGAFTVNLPPNSTASPSIQPSGTQWNFSYQSQGGYGAANINVTITGAGSISGTLSNLTRITWPYGNIPPPGGSGQGIVFVSSTTLGWGTTIGLSTLPTSPNGVSFIDTSTPSGGIAVAPAWSWPGVTTSQQNGTTYTLLAADRATCILANNASAQTYTIPDAGGTNFQFFYNFCLTNKNAGTITVVRTAASTFTIGSLTGLTNFTLLPNATAYFYTDPANNWQVVLIGESQCGLTVDAIDCIGISEAVAATNGTLTNGLPNQAILALSTLTNSTATPLEVVQGQITNTVATPAVAIEANWNNAGLTGEGLLFNATDTSSNTNSQLLDFRTNNTVAFAVSKNGLAQMSGIYSPTLVAAPSPAANNTNGWKYSLAARVSVGVDGNNSGNPGMEEFHIIGAGQAVNSWLSTSNGTTGGTEGTPTTPNTNAGAALGTNGGLVLKENACATSFTNDTGRSLLCPDSTLHEYLAYTNGSASAGMLVRRQPGATSQKSETTTADANVLTFTPPSTIGTYRACVVISVSSATAGVISWTLSWTDSNGNAQSNIAQGLFQQGTAAPNTTFTTSAAGNYNGCSTFDVNNAGANVVVKWVGGGTTAAKMSATIERLQ